MLEVDAGFTMPADGADSYDVEVRYGGHDLRPQAGLRSALPWRYVGVLHEYVTCPEARSEAALAGCARSCPTRARAHATPTPIGGTR